MAGFTRVMPEHSIFSGKKFLMVLLKTPENAQNSSPFFEHSAFCRPPANGLKWPKMGFFSLFSKKMPIYRPLAFLSYCLFFSSYMIPTSCKYRFSKKQLPYYRQNAKDFGHSPFLAISRKKSIFLFVLYWESLTLPKVETRDPHNCFRLRRKTE